jgi:hypothetical protein
MIYSWHVVGYPLSSYEFARTDLRIVFILEVVPGKERFATRNGCFCNTNFGYHLPTENVGGDVSALYDFPGYVPGGVEINYGARRGRFALGDAWREAGADWKFLRGNHIVVLISGELLNFNQSTWI